MELEEQQHEKRAALGTTKLAEAQRAQVQEARTNARGRAPRPRRRQGRGGQVRARVRDARRRRGVAAAGRDQEERLLAAENAYSVAQSRLGELSARQSQELRRPERSSRRAARSSPSCGCSTRRRRSELAIAEEKLRLQLQTARLVAEAAARIRFENIDKDNFLLIFAPVSGVITDVTSTQPGDKVQANTPLGGIAPSDARPVLKIEIAEQDRAFLREGLPVKLKFSAFPYQRYGLIDGTLNFISPATKLSPQTKQPVYEGRVTLEQDHYLVADTKYPLRYGMTATAEVVVRERRLIDLALDPFRQIGG